MASLSDVTHTYTERGVTHIVCSSNGGWLHLLCGTLITADALRGWPMKARICRKCRSRIEAATVPADDNRQTAGETT